MKAATLASVVLVLLLGVPKDARPQCNCTEGTNASFPRTLLKAYVAEFEALVTADTLDRDGVGGGDLRAIARLFRRTETMVRKGQVLQISGRFEQAKKRFVSAVGLTDKLGEMIAEADQAGELASVPGDRLSDRRNALAVEVGRLRDDVTAGTCYGQCQEVCDPDGGCYGLAYRCQCMWNACYPTCSIIE